MLNLTRVNILLPEKCASIGNINNCRFNRMFGTSTSSYIVAIYSYIFMKNSNIIKTSNDLTALIIIKFLCKIYDIYLCSSFICIFILYPYAIQC